MTYQLSIFLENNPGHFKRVTSALNGAAINIRTMTLSTTTLGWGVLNLIVSDPQKALGVLKSGDFSATLRQIVVLDIEDIPGGLDKMLGILDAAGINIENAYARVVEEGIKAFLVVDVDNIDEVELKLKEMNVFPLSEEQVYGN